jgi:hypothetical protein
MTGSIGQVSHVQKNRHFNANFIINPAIMKYLVLFISLCVLFTKAHSQTTFGKGTGEYGELLRNLEKDMLDDVEMRVVNLGGRSRTIFVPWIRDHVHVTKAMKYLQKDVASFTEFYLENQTSEGLYFDYYFPLEKERGVSMRKNIFDKRYWKIILEDSIEMHRLPVEADLEYLLVEGVFAIWQSTNDLTFVKKWLPSLVKGMQYSMTDPLRWSQKHKLVKRGYTLDTWDFMQLPQSREEYTKNGGDVQKGIFDIDSKTPMGIMHGDNSGMYAACRQLAILFREIGDVKSSEKWSQEAELFRKKTNTLCWNGKYYAHFIADDPQPDYLKMDQKNTLTLSNPYDINRGLPTESMAQSIIKTYLELKESNKKNSFSEWYGIYPAVQPHFADYKPGSYMNGGVNTIVGGELAKAAFQHGYEQYGVDILKRMIELMKKHNGRLPVSYTPEGKVDEGIPDNWGQAAVYSAMIEGLAGVVDKGTQFSNVEISPRWLAAGKNEAEVSIAYGPTGAAVKYSYKHDEVKKIVTISIKANISNGIVRVLLPENAKAKSVVVNHKKSPIRHELVNKSQYVMIKDVRGNLIDIEISY